MPLTNPDNVVNLAASNTTFAASNNTVNFSGQGAVTVGTAANQVNISAPTQTVQTQNLHNVSLSTSAGGGTAGTMAEISSGTVSLYAGNNITLSQSATNKVVISGPNTSAQQIGISSVAASDATYTSGQVQFTGSNIVTVRSTTGQKVVVDAVYPSLPYWDNYNGDLGPRTNITAFSKQPFYFPVTIPGNIVLNTFGYMMSRATSGLDSFSAHLGVYTYANSTSANLVSSTSYAYVVSTASSASNSGLREFIGNGLGAMTLTPGAYVFGMMFSAGATASMNYSIFGNTMGALGAVFPGTNQLSTGVSQGQRNMFGRGSTTVNAMPANVVRSELQQLGAAASGLIVPSIFIRS